MDNLIEEIDQFAAHCLDTNTPQGEEILLAASREIKMLRLKIDSRDERYSDLLYFNDKRE